MKKRGLGRGLDALLNVGAAAGQEDVPPDGVLRVLPIERVVRGRYQPRQDIREDSLQELAASLRAQGMVQPIVVRETVEHDYEIIAGERRWRAAQLAGLAEVPALIRQVSDLAAMAIALIENIQREDLNPLEESHALKRLIDECQMTHQQAADAVGRSRTAVTNLLRLLELSEDVQQLVRDRKLEMGHARALLPLPLALQREAAHQILVRGLSVRETEALVRRLQSAAPSQPVEKRPDPNIRVLQEDLSQRLGAKVALQHSATGKGRLVIYYNNLDELDGILGHVR